jgi:hypothetical protein
MKFCIFTCKIKPKNKYTCLKIMKMNQILFSLKRKRAPRGRGGRKHSGKDIGDDGKAI